MKSMIYNDQVRLENIANKKFFVQKKKYLIYDTEYIEAYSKPFIVQNRPKRIDNVFCLYA